MFDGQHSKSSLIEPSHMRFIEVLRLQKLIAVADLGARGTAPEHIHANIGVAVSQPRTHLAGVTALLPFLKQLRCTSDLGDDALGCS